MPWNRTGWWQNGVLMCPVVALDSLTSLDSWRPTGNVHLVTANARNGNDSWVKTFGSEAWNGQFSAPLDGKLMEDLTLCPILSRNLHTESHSACGSFMCSGSMRALRCSQKLNTTGGALCCHAFLRPLEMNAILPSLQFCDAQSVQSAWTFWTSKPTVFVLTSWNSQETSLMIYACNYNILPPAKPKLQTNLPFRGRKTLAANIVAKIRRLILAAKWPSLPQKLGDRAIPRGSKEII